MIPITPEQRQALQTADGSPVYVTDRVLQRKYVLMPAAQYDRCVTTLIDAGVDLATVFPPGTDA